MDIPFVPDTSPDTTLVVSTQGAKLISRLVMDSHSAEGLTEHGADVLARLRRDVACAVLGVCEHDSCPNE